MNKLFTLIRISTKYLLLIIAVVLIQRSNVINNHQKLVNENLNKTLDLTAMAVKLNEIQLADNYYPLDTFTGDLTGYGADCALCSGKLGCTGQDVRDGTTTYVDSTYGTVNIVASSKNLKCGSIITWDNYGTKMTAIVLDRGVLGTDIDLLSPSEAYASDYVGRHKITYDVLRFGWTRN